jgi:hypothetical protein
VLAHGHDVGQHLRWVILVGKAVVDRYSGISGELLHAFLRRATILDSIEHAAEHAGGVLERLLVADLGTGWIQVGDVGALVVAGYLERTTSAGGRLLENETDLLAV